MQRSKIKVGEEYAVSNFRDWAHDRSRTDRVQVLSVEPWLAMARWQAENDTSPAETVPEPGSEPKTLLEVSRRYRRFVPTKWNKSVGTLVLVRGWLEDRDGSNGHWGEPSVTETRRLVAPGGDAEKQFERRRIGRDPEAPSGEAERNRLAEREGRINERMRDVGIVMQARVERSRFNREHDVLTIRADMLEDLLRLAERGFEGTREFEPES